MIDLLAYWRNLVLLKDGRQTIIHECLRFNERIILITTLDVLSLYNTRTALNLMWYCSVLQ